MCGMVQKKKEYYSVQEFADFVGVHYNTIYKSIRKGHLEAIRMGSGKNASYRISHSEIQRLGLFNLEEIIDNLVEKKLKEIQHRN